MNTLKFWIKNARDIALPQSILPALLAVSMAAVHPDFSWWPALVALFGVVCAHLGFNLADDYFDYRHNDVEARKKVTAEGFRTHMEKCHYIESGEATPKELLMAMCAFLAVAGVAGGVVWWFRGWPVAVLALAGLLLGISYSGKPLELGYHGLGELVIGVMFGPLLMIGMQFAACGVFDDKIVWVSAAVGARPESRYASRQNDLCAPASDAWRHVVVFGTVQPDAVRHSDSRRGGGAVALGVSVGAAVVADGHLSDLFAGRALERQNHSVRAALVDGPDGQFRTLSPAQYGLVSDSLARGAQLGYLFLPDFGDCQCDFSVSLLIISY